MFKTGWTLKYLNAVHFDFTSLTYFSFIKALDIYILEIRSTCFRISFKNVFANFLLFLREISKLVKKIVNIWIYNTEHQR